MIKFFRKIRESLITQNKLGKYLVYAFGEIVLVVIGILLALNINNKNEERINKAKFVKIFKEIQDDLVEDTQRANRIFDRHILDDSIQDLILNNKFTREDYRLKNARRLGNLYVDFVIQTNGYDNLISNIDNVPEKYKPLLKDLKHLYVRLKTTIDVYNTRIRETVYKNIDHTYELEWYQKSVKGIISDEAIDYFLEDPHYKGQVIKYCNDRQNIFGISQFYKQRAFNMYHEIYEAISSNDSIPELVKKERFDNEVYNAILGEYKLKDKVGDYFKDMISVIKEDDVYYLVDSDGKYELLWYKENYFEVEGTYCQVNKFNEGDLFWTWNISGNATYTKIE
ncbi:hypothetical protein RM697_03655 [Ichthyenterobacterium sp. W332]|uniref:Phage abortive infection protein n=1 Tax=Microcosmobacter mediterraneus TaxID=3075607 RepID=A0ABU2YIL3_9FLAO|nr:hypothetical protein [Ichthyenterobacterium sp. W332]MDT0557726.1 hypothetical protein [Ichthyenterobacterium sp. W332]